MKHTIFPSHTSLNSMTRSVEYTPGKKPWRILTFSLLAICWLLTACQDDARFAGFDSKTWKNDKSGCKGERQAMQADFEKIRLALKGLSQMEVVAVLGSPDLQRLDERQTKSYLYFLEPGNTCAVAKPDARVVVVRFSAVDNAFEITYEQGTPL